MNAKTGLSEDLRATLRIIWAITAKDILEGVKNKTTLSVLLSALFLVGMYSVLPMLESGDAPPNLLVYDAGESTLVTRLDNSSAVKLYTYPSQEKMEYDLVNGYLPELGLVFPANLDQLLAVEGTLTLEGYVLHWVSESDANELARLVEGELAQMVGKPAQIHLTVVHTLPESDGIGVWAAMALVFVVLMVGMLVPTHLILEEKRAKTIDVLLVSPAGAGQMVVAKVLTGLFYCLVGAGVALAVNYSLVTQWWLAILATVCGSLFAVALSLLLGTALENRQQLLLWGWVCIVPLMLPPMLSVMEPLIPKTVVNIMQGIPTVALFNVFRVSFSSQAQLGLFVPGLLWNIACAGAVLFVVIWLLRRSDR